eukprot:GEMP01109634.1.p1 GENE.GEMP01109634.1~~GEMP01109634.1.p1  ORF type:complete len:174 (+),score=36.10 GEMP01109634.1:184-705(+)
MRVALFPLVCAFVLRIPAGQQCSCDCCATTDRPQGESGVMCAQSFSSTKQCSVTECEDLEDIVLAANAGLVAYARFCLVNCCPSSSDHGSVCIKLTSAMTDDAETRGGNGNDLKCKPLSERLGYLPTVKPAEPEEKPKEEPPCKYKPCSPPSTRDILKEHLKDIKRSTEAALN